MPATVITLSDGTTTVTLPADLEWSDEYAWQPVEQSIEFSVTGAVIIEHSTRLAGRPITLSGDSNRCILTRATLDQLDTWAGTTAQQLTLTLRAVARTVLFAQPNAIEATQLVAGAPIDSVGGGRYTNITLRFVEI